MNTEVRLREALRERADGIEPGPDSWNRLRSRIEAPVVVTTSGPRGTLALTGVACVLVLAFVVALVVVGRDSGENTRVTTMPTAPMPERILAVRDTGQVVMLDATTGQQLAAYDVDGVGMGTQIAVTPDAQDAYVVQGDDKGCDDEHAILRLSLESSDRPPPRVAAAATSPTVSPDGRYLAYLRCQADGAPGSSRPVEIVLHDLVTGEDRVTGAAGGARFAESLWFAADSRHVAFVLYGDASSGASTWHELDLVGGEAFPGRVLPLSSNVFWLGYRGATSEFLGTTDGRFLVADSRDATTTRRLLDLTSAPTRASADVSGRHLAILDGGDLARWSVGERKPTKVADGVAAAAWIPDAAEQIEAPASTMPGRVIAASYDRLVALNVQSGSEQQELGSFPGLDRVSAAHDGSTVVFARTGALPSACDDFIGPEIDRLDVQSGSTAIVVGGSFAPAVSPNGLVAYGFLCEGGTLGFTDADGRNYRSAPLGDARRESSETVEIVEPLDWSPDGTRLLYRIDLKGDAIPRYVVGRLWPAVPQAETEVIEVASGQDLTGAAFLDDETVALAEFVGNGTEVRSWPLREADGAEHPSAVLFTVPGRVTSLVSDPTGQHLLAVNQGDVLYRWSRGDAQPTKVADGVHSAAWLP